MKISSNYILDEVINYLREKKKTNAGYVYSDFIVTSENHSFYIYIYIYIYMYIYKSKIKY